MRGIAEYLATSAKDVGLADDETLRDLAERLASSPAEAEPWLRARLERGDAYLAEHGEAEQQAERLWRVLLVAYELAVDLQAAALAWPLASVQSLRTYPYCGVGARIGSHSEPRMIRSHLPSGVWQSYRVPYVRDWAQRYAATDCYATLWRYAEPVRDTKALKAVAKDGPVLFEIDAHDRPLAAAHADAQRLVERLLALGVSPERLHVSFSGNGFHVLADVGLPPSPALPRHARRFALALARDIGITIDERCYDDSRLLRLIGSRHRASGRRKVALTLDDLAAPLERIIRCGEDARRLCDRSAAR